MRFTTAGQAGAEGQRCVLRRGQLEDPLPQSVLVAVGRDDLVEAQAAELFAHRPRGVAAEAGQEAPAARPGRRRRGRARGVVQGERPRRAGAAAGGALDAEVVQDGGAPVADPDRRRWGRRRGSAGSRGSAPRRCPGTRAAPPWSPASGRSLTAKLTCVPAPTVDVTRRRSLLRAMLGSPRPAPKPSARASAGAVE